MFSKVSRQLKVILVFTAISFALAIINTLEGPRLRYADVTLQPNQNTVALHFNSSLSKESLPDLTIEPSVDFETTMTKSSLVVKFVEPLRFDTTYSMQLHNITSTSGRSSTHSYSFKTPAGSFAYMRRNDTGLDQILQNSPGKQPKVLYESERIADFTFGKSGLLIIEDDPADETTTKLYLASGKRKKELIPPRGSAISVHSISSSSVYFIRTQEPVTFVRHLYAYDATTQLFTELPAQEAKLNASKVIPAPDGKSIFFQDATNNTAYLDLYNDDRPPLGLGVISRIVQVMNDNSGIFTQDQPGRFAFLKAQDNTITSSGLLGTIIDARKMQAEAGYVLLRSRTNIGSSRQLLTLENTDGSIINLYELDSSNGLFGFETLTLSPNDQYISIEVAEQPVKYSGFRFNQKPENAETLLFNNEGVLINRIEGTGIQWL